MNSDTKRALIRVMFSHQQRMLSEASRFDDFVGGSFWEGSLGHAVSCVMDNAVRSCCAATGLDYDAACWFMYDNDFGARGFEFECGVEGKMVAIKTVDDFLDSEGF